MDIMKALPGPERGSTSTTRRSKSNQKWDTSKRSGRRSSEPFGGVVWLFFDGESDVGLEGMYFTR